MFEGLNQENDRELTGFVVLLRDFRLNGSQINRLLPLVRSAMSTGHSFDELAREVGGVVAEYNSENAPTVSVFARLERILKEKSGENSKENI